MDKLQLESPLLTMKLSNMMNSLYTINEENNAYFVLSKTVLGVDNLKLGICLIYTSE